MKYKKMTVTILVLMTIACGFLVMMPHVDEERAKRTAAAGESGDGIAAGESGQDGTSAENGDVRDAVSEPEVQTELIFDIQYDKYLIPEPYTYEVGQELRYFHFEEMLAAVLDVEKAYENGLWQQREMHSATGIDIDGTLQNDESTIDKLGYIDNYKNRNGWAPYWNGKAQDSEGTYRYASAPGYLTSDMAGSEFIYILDGTLVKILEDNEDFTKVQVVYTGKEYYVPSKYIDTGDCITDFSKAVVVDRANQNIATFEKVPARDKATTGRENDWVIRSYSLATTGKEGKYHQPTPLGYYFAIEKKYTFYYLKDGTNVIEGYAPYAVRFTSGAYIHGVATAYKYAADGSKIDAGFQEYSKTIGTVPLSHECVRNYTSHAKFMYDWYEHGKTVVIVIE